MHPGRYVALLLGLPCLLAIEVFGYYGFRSILPLSLRSPEVDGGLGMSSEQLVQVLGHLTWMSGLSPLLGGAIAIATGPRITLVAGALLGVVAYAGLALTGNGGLLLWLALWALAYGLFRPSLYAVAGMELAPAREGYRFAPFLLMYGAVNISALVAPAAAGLTRHVGDPRTPVCVGAALAMLLVAGGAAALALLKGKHRPPSSGGRVELGLLLLVVLLGPALAAFGLAFEQLFRGASSHHSTATLGAIMSINPLVVIVAAGVAGIAMLALGAVRAKPPTMILLGIGALVAALASTPLLLTGASVPPVALYGTAAITGLAEVLVLALGAARMATGTHPRFATLILAVWFATSRGLHGLASFLGEVNLSKIMLALCAIGCLISGGLLIGLGRKLQRRCFDIAEVGSAPAPAPGLPADAAPPPGAPPGAA